LQSGRKSSFASGDKGWNVDDELGSGDGRKTAAGLD
jgi:hypothetical protein